MPPLRTNARAVAAQAAIRVRNRLQQAAQPRADTAPPRDPEHERRVERLTAMYEALRGSYLPSVEPAADGLPGVRQIEAVEKAALTANTAYAHFFRAAGTDGDLDRAMVQMTRRLITASDSGRARSFAQLMQQYEQFRPVADICVAMCALVEPMPETAWALFTRNDLGLVVSHAAAEYFRFGFGWDPQTAEKSLARVLDGSIAFDADPETWLDIACHSFYAGADDLSAQALARAEAHLPEVRDAARRQRLDERGATLHEWYGRRAAAARPAPLAPGEVSIAIVDHKHPDRRLASNDLTDAVDTLAVLGHLVRRDDVTIVAEPDLAEQVERVRADLAPGRRVAGPRADVRLQTVHRDASRLTDAPDGTWVFVTDWFRHPLGWGAIDLPLDARLRPVFVSFAITPKALAAPGAIEYLREHGPIGCRDRETVALLQSAQVPAFYSGPITATLDLLVGPAAADEQSGASDRTLFVDVTPDGPGNHVGSHWELTRSRSLAENLAQAAQRVHRFHTSGARVVTCESRIYAAARAVARSAEYRPTGTPAAAAGDVARMSDTQFARLQAAITDKLTAVLDAVLAGRTDADVYAVWREVCAADVAAADALRGVYTSQPQLSFDVAEVCRTIRAASVTVERSQPGPAGEEMNVEFSLDANYRHQLDIVLDSVVERSSRPVRAFVLCRGLEQADYDRMARLFPTVSFVWLPTDTVDYGRISGMNPWVTPATMDRTMLPVLLGEVDRILHFDLDALCLSDLAELYGTDLDDVAIAASAEPQPRYVGGWDTFVRQAGHLRKDGDHDKALEVMVRMAARHPFDFDVFNAGIMVMNLDRMRRDDFCGTYLPYVQEFGLNGQVVLNAYLGRDWRDVGGEWNRLMRLEMPDEPKIAHWAGPYKPWPFHQYVTGRELWREQERRFAERTAALEG